MDILWFGSLPIDGYDFRVKGESSRTCFVLIPDGSTVVWSIKRIVDTKGDNEEPGDESEDPVGQKRALAMAFTLDEGVHCRPSR